MFALLARIPPMLKRPLSVTIISWVLIASGLAGIIYHLSELRPAFQPGGPTAHYSEILLVLLVRVAAIVCGIFMLRGSNWARWLAIAWIGTHVIIGALNSVQQLVVHMIVFVIFVYCLFRRAATDYFRGNQKSNLTADQH